MQHIVGVAGCVERSFLELTFRVVLSRSCSDVGGVQRSVNTGFIFPSYLARTKPALQGVLGE